MSCEICIYSILCLDGDGKELLSNFLKFKEWGEKVVYVYKNQTYPFLEKEIEQKDTSHETVTYPLDKLIRWQQERNNSKQCFNPNPRVYDHLLFVFE